MAREVNGDAPANVEVTVEGVRDGAHSPQQRERRSAGGHLLRARLGQAPGCLLVAFEHRDLGGELVGDVADRQPRMELYVARPERFPLAALVGSRMDRGPWSRPALGKGRRRRWWRSVDDQQVLAPPSGMWPVEIPSVLELERFDNWPLMGQAT